MSVALAVHINGFGARLCSIKYASIASMRSWTLVNVPRLMAFTVMSRKKRSMGATYTFVDL